MNNVLEVKVGLQFGADVHSVGRLAIRDSIIYFQYDEHFRQQGIEISPFRLPLQNNVIALPVRPFEGLSGVFSDSLPDGWGRLLFDRMLRSQGISAGNTSPLDRLAHVGFFGLGALVYEPDHSLVTDGHPLNLDELAFQAEQVIHGDSTEVINELLALNGSSAGAHPKALIGVAQDYSKVIFGAGKLEKGFDPWLVKFPHSQDGKDSGAIEYLYALMAKSAGVIVPEVHLFSAEKGAGYFAIKRFDREENKRLHVHTASGLLHSDFRSPSLDYEDLLNLTGSLTKDIREVEKMFRLAVFNVLANNKDDHGKNFSFLMNDMGDWRLSPAYDLTFSSGPNGEQSTMVMGEGKRPRTEHLIKLGMEAKLPKKLIGEIIDQTKDVLTSWKDLSRGYNIDQSNIKLISDSINRSIS